MGKRTYFFIFVLVAFFFSHPGIGCLAAGTSGATVLKQTSGARPLGMGEAFVALADDVNALTFNPAGLAHIRNHEISVMYLDSLVDTWFGFIGYAHPIGGKAEREAKGRRFRPMIARRNRATIGLAVSIFQAGKMVLDPEGKTVRAEEDYLANLGFGYTILRGGEKGERMAPRARSTSQLRNEVSLGLAIKFLHSTLVEKYSATAFAFDVGALGKFMIGKSRLQLGVTAQNLGTKIKFEEEGDTLPLTVRAGGSYRMDFGKEHKFTISGEALKPNDGDFRGSGGMEYWYREIFALRAGYKVGYDLGSFTCGAGLAWKDYEFNYGWGMSGSKMGDNHRFSLTARF